MKTYATLQEMAQAVKPTARPATDGALQWTDRPAFVANVLQPLAATASLAGDTALRDAASAVIHAAALADGAVPASIHELYMAMGRGEVTGFTVPAINIRGLTVDTARAIFRSMHKVHTNAVLFELARSEMEYTYQPPSIYAPQILAAAIAEGHKGPVFIQGDHFQVKAKKFHQDRNAEVGAIKDLIREAIPAGFYNIDVDTSTLVELSKGTQDEQQRLNYEICAELTDFIRSLEPSGVTVSVGGEIGEVGGKNSTVEELEAYMDGYVRDLERRRPGARGISKVSVQTGTTHGGVPLPDGSVADVKLDFVTLESMSRVAREKYGLSGAVQHGASTLPRDLFDKFPAVGTSEIHLATQFQNLVIDHDRMPADLRDEMYAHLREACASERSEGQTDEQFIYKTRKKAWGIFKEQLLDLPADVRHAFAATLEEEFDFLFGKLNIENTASTVNDYVKPVVVRKPIPKELV